MAAGGDPGDGIPTRPFPIVLSAPSGAGKTTVAARIFQRYPDLAFAVSMTTRPRRGGETDGSDYRFVDTVAFARARDGGELAEWAVVHGHLYGTPRSEIDRALAGGRNVLLDVDVQGGKSLTREYPDAVSIFLLPPSYDAMAARLRGRGTEDRGAIDGRLAEALRELRSVEQYGYVIVNHEVERTVDTFAHIIESEACRRERRDGLEEWLDERFPQRLASRGTTSEGGSG